MIASVFIWIAVAAILLIVLIGRIVSENRNAHVRSHRHFTKHNLKFFELGKEQEEFAAAGDPGLISADDDYDIYYNS